MFEHCKENLERKGYRVSVFPDAETAAAYLTNSVSGKTVGFGDSLTLFRLGLFDRLSESNRVYDPMHPLPGEDFWQTARKTLLTDVFLTSVNALAETGELVNIDGTGNRIAGSLFGHEKVYFVAGRNKLASTLEEAVMRARTVAGPANAHRQGNRTPCAAEGVHCYDCASPDRICCALTVYYRKMRYVEMEVVLIEEDLGL